MLPLNRLELSLCVGQFACYREQNGIKEKKTPNFRKSLTSEFSQVVNGGACFQPQGCVFPKPMHLTPIFLH